MLALTNAPIPRWASMEDARIEKEYRTTELESWFKDLNKGSTISTDYIMRLETFLREVHNYITLNSAKMPISDMFCDIIQITKVLYDKDQRMVDIVEPLIRPCAQDMGFLSLLVWQLIQSCKKERFSLSIHATSEKLKTDLLQICPYFREMRRGQRFGTKLHHVMFLDINDILQIRMSSQQLGIDHMLIETGENVWDLKLNPHHLPSARQLMDQMWVDAGEMRIGRRGSVDEVSDLMSSLHVMRRKRSGDDDDDNDKMETESASRRRRLKF